MTAFEVSDLYRHKRISSVSSASDGAAIYSAIKSVDKDNDGYASHICKYFLDGRPVEQLTSGSGQNSSPQVSPHRSELAYLSNCNNGTTQIFLRSQQGETRQLGNFVSGVSQFRWASDGQSIFATAASPIDPDANGARELPEKPPSKATPEVCWKLPYKADGVGYLLRREIALYRLDVATGSSTLLTPEPCEVFGFAPSPDGKKLAYTRSRARRFAHCTDLWICDIDGTNHRQVSTTLSSVLQPSWSPQSNLIAFSGAVKEGDGEMRLWLLDLQSNSVRCLDSEIEVADAEAIFWRDRNDAISFVRAHRGRHELVDISISNGKVTPILTGDHQIAAITPCGKSWAYAVDVPTQPSELFVCDGQGKNAKQITSINSWWNEKTPLVMESRRFNVPDGKGGRETIEGLLLHAKDAQAGPRPLLVDVHGGPASYVLLDYESNVYWQALCSQGWAVLLLNTVGSSSFGSEFCCRLSGNWGTLDLPQYEESIKSLLAEGVCDDRICIAGKSYGGYFTAWAIGHTDMFNAAVVMAPVGNIETHYGTSDGGYYADPLYMGTPKFDRAKARELSPLQHIEKAKTPTLFMQGKDDERCPKCQSEELFVSLYNQNQVATELVLYPNEGHSFLGQGKPSCREDAAARIVRWVNTYVGEKATLDVQYINEHYESKELERTEGETETHPAK